MILLRSRIINRSILKSSRLYKLDNTLQYKYFSDQPFPSPYPNRPVVDHKKEQNIEETGLSNNNALQNWNPKDSNNNNDNYISIDNTLDKLKTSSSTTNTLQPSYNRQHHFDTYRLLEALEKQGFTRSQAEVVMKGIKYKLRESTALLRKQLLLRSDLENESYLFKAELSELRTEIQVMRRNDTQMLQTEAAMITREVEALAQRLREDVSTMKNEVTLDMNNRKNETQEEQKAIDMKIQEINNKFTVQMGEVRTELEAVRWETIWKGMAGVVGAGMGIATLGYILTKFADRQAEAARLEKLKKKKLLKEEARQSGAADMEVIY
ncbi:hypothetical protein BJ944DRAFT_264239 [Cunninghamella echinulata]|nr:hypothetical protein BJ944DRAFT_264239 [Cunninghamella echinulata]